MLILGIETSCDDTAAAVVSAARGELRVLSNVVSTQTKQHSPYGGVVPTLAAREHEQNLPLVLQEAFKVSGLKFKDIDLMAVTSGPGLIMSLVKGVNFAKELAKKYKKPLIGVNHIEGHIYSNWLGIEVQPQETSQRLNLGDRATKSSTALQLYSSIAFPALCLIVSGGHTELVLMRDHGQYELIGRTVDDAAGEAFDKIARILGLGYPGGPALAAEAAEFSISNFQFPIKLPRPMINSKDFNFSFAGLKTAALYLVHDLISSPDAKKRAIRSYDRQYMLDEIRAPIAREAQEAIVDVLAAKTLRAARQNFAKTKLRRAARSILLAGGVSANERLRERMHEIAGALGVSLFMPPLQYTTDNAAMICAAAYYKIKNQIPASPAGRSKIKSENVEANANWEIA